MIRKIQSRALVAASLLAAALFPVLAAANPLTEEWSLRWNGPADNQDLVNALHVDSGGVLYATGESNFASFTLGVEADSGQLLWEAPVGGHAILDAGDGTVVVAGGGPSSTYGDWNLTRVDPAGNVLWSRTDVGGSFLALGGPGRIHAVATWSHYSGYRVNCVDIDGNVLWTNHVNSLSKTAGMVVAPDGYTYVVGDGNYQVVNGFGSTDVELIKLDAAGQIVWTQTWDSGGNDEVRGLVLGADGLLIVGAEVETGSGSQTTALAFEPDGTLRWQNTVLFSTWDFFGGIAADGLSRVHLAGWGYSTTSYSYDRFVATYDGASGQHLGTVVHDTPGDVSTEAFTADEAGWGYAVGEGDVYAEVVTSVFDAQGTLAATASWMNQYGPSSRPAFIRAIHVDSEASVYIAGGAYQEIGNYGDALDFIIVKYPSPRDGDGDGWLLPADCDDGDPTVYPGAPETTQDGIDQDCNGYDLSIELTKAHYEAKKDILVVEATSDWGASANLVLQGYGAMTWKRNKSVWQYSADPAGGNPGTVTVCGFEGCLTTVVGIP